jgi:hypothetical protein
MVSYLTTSGAVERLEVAVIWRLGGEELNNLGKLIVSVGFIHCGQTCIVGLTHMQSVGAVKRIAGLFPEC